MDRFYSDGWRETISKALKGKYRSKSRSLWRVMKYGFPEKFSGKYPESAEALEVVLAEFKTKRQLDEEWSEKNARTWLDV